MGAYHTTHVANAYDKNIYVMVDSDQGRVMEHDLSSLFEGKHKEYDWLAAQKDGYSKVVPGCFTAFNPHLHLHSTVYISIFAEDGERIAKCHSLRPGISVIVSKEGSMVPQKYGDDLWIDKFGTNHKREITTVKEDKTNDVPEAKCVPEITTQSDEPPIHVENTFINIHLNK